MTELTAGYALHNLSEAINLVNDAFLYAPVALADRDELGKLIAQLYRIASAAQVRRDVA